MHSGNCRIKSANSNGGGQKRFHGILRSLGIDRQNPLPSIGDCFKHLFVRTNKDRRGLANCLAVQNLKFSKIQLSIEIILRIIEMDMQLQNTSKTLSVADSIQFDSELYSKVAARA